MFKRLKQIKEAYELQPYIKHYADMKIFEEWGMLFSKEDFENLKKQKVKLRFEDDLQYIIYNKNIDTTIEIKLKEWEIFRKHIKTKSFETFGVLAELASMANPKKFTKEDIKEFNCLSKQKLEFLSKLARFICRENLSLWAKNQSKNRK